MVISKKVTRKASVGFSAGAIVAISFACLGLLSSIFYLAIDLADIKFGGDNISSEEVTQKTYLILDSTGSYVYSITR